MTNKLTTSYIMPNIEVVEAIIEVGFQGSSNIEDPIEDETQGWD